MDHTDSDHSDYSDEFSFRPLSEIAQTNDQPRSYSDQSENVGNIKTASPKLIKPIAHKLKAEPSVRLISSCSNTSSKVKKTAVLPVSGPVLDIVVILQKLVEFSQTLCQSFVQSVWTVGTYQMASISSYEMKRKLHETNIKETIQPSISQKLNEQIGKGEIIQTKKETLLGKKRVKEEEMIFKKYLKVANMRMKKYKKKSKRQLEKEEKENKMKLKKEQKERARLGKKEMKDRKKLEKEIMKKEETEKKNDNINMPVVIENMDIAIKKSDEDFKDDGKGNLNNEEKKNTIGKRIQDFFRSLICA
ncbi:Hypothetical predicted protein [Mytilus galloprovincialis]|uniref:Uncharacterized protein n=1 Tax=Mytilus galloprovincialis TaxID=29158 RepID=A0A8B6D919_MYTGA|nr:Hypothetical predicted protein [Mytilus galloprovincialis]